MLILKYARFYLKSTIDIIVASLRQICQHKKHNRPEYYAGIMLAYLTQALNCGTWLKNFCDLFRICPFMLINEIARLFLLPIIKTVMYV